MLITNSEFNTMIIQTRLAISRVVHKTCHQLIKLLFNSSWWCKMWSMMKTTEFCFWKTSKKRSLKNNLIKFALNTDKSWRALSRKSTLVTRLSAEVSLRWLLEPSSRLLKQWKSCIMIRTTSEMTYKLIFINLRQRECSIMNRRIIQSQILSWACLMLEHSTPIHITMVASIDHRQTTTNSMDSSNHHLHLSITPISRIIKEIMATAIIHNSSSRTRGPPCLAIISSKTAKETTGQVDIRVDQQTSIINIPTTKGKTINIDLIINLRTTSLNKLIWVHSLNSKWMHPSNSSQQLTLTQWCLCPWPCQCQFPCSSSQHSLQLQLQLLSVWSLCLKSTRLNWAPNLMRLKRSSTLETCCMPTLPRLMNHLLARSLVWSSICPWTRFSKTAKIRTCSTRQSSQLSTCWTNSSLSLSSNLRLMDSRPLKRLIE